MNRHIKGWGVVEIGCVVPCDIIWLPRLLYCHVLVAKPFEVVSLKAAIAVRQKQEIYWDELSDRLPTFSSIPFWETLPGSLRGIKCLL